MKRVMAALKAPRIMDVAVKPDYVEKGMSSVKIYSSGSGWIWVSSNRYQPGFVRLLRSLCWPFLKRVIGDNGISFISRLPVKNSATSLTVPSGEKYRIKVFCLYSFDVRTVALPAEPMVVNRDAVRPAPVALLPAKLNNRVGAFLHLPDVQTAVRFRMPAIRVERVSCFPANICTASAIKNIKYPKHQSIFTWSYGERNK